MKIPKTLINATILMTATATSASAQELPQFGKDPVDEIVKAMTLEEKVNFLLGTNRSVNYSPDAAPGMPVRTVETDLQTLTDVNNENTEVVSTAFTNGRVQGAAGETYGIPRLGIPVFVVADGPAGLRIDSHREGDKSTYYCTAFPTGTSLAASWDTDLVKEVTEAMGNEVREYGVDILLAPGMNIMRSPLCGRNFEYYSEDPVLAGNIAAAYINGIQSNGVGTSLKHFAVNNQETYRNGINAILSDRALREIYLKGFEIAVKDASPWTIMTSYNKINGALASTDKYLLTEILRGEWNYDGFVMTDWWSEGNGADQVTAGNDLLMPGSQRQYDEIIEAVKTRTLDEALIDRNVANILIVMLRTPTAKHLGYSNHPDLKAHAETALDAATEGMVLLENRDLTLPLAKNQRVAMFGNASYDTYVGGTGSGNVNRAYKVNINEGMENAGYDIDGKLAKKYKSYIEKEKADKPADNFWTITEVDEMPLDDETIEVAANSNDVALLTISRMAGEGGDRKVEKGDWYLSDTERSNLNRITEAFHKQGKKIIVLLNMGSIIDMADWHENPDAILHTWLPGQEAGNAVASVLSGKVSPSGKLPLTISRQYADYPSSNNFPHSENPATTYYAEDIFVGYRHFDKKGIEPLYPFGYGLSYSDFEYSGLKVQEDGDCISVWLDVTNTGTKTGRESVQIYVKAPGKDMPKPEKELKGFAKTKALAPGESERISVKIPRSSLASYNEYYHKWTLEPGEYVFKAAPSAIAEGLSASIKIE